MRSTWKGLCASAAILAALSCSDQPAAAPSPRLSTAFVAGDPSLGNQIIANINAAFTNSTTRSLAKHNFYNAWQAMNAGQGATAQGYADVVEDMGINAFGTGQIADLDGSGPLTPVMGLAELINQIDVFVGRHSRPHVSPNAEFYLIKPSASDQTIISHLDADVIVPGNSTTRPALLYIDRTTNPNFAAPGTPLSPVFEVHYTPDISFTTVTVALCVWPPAPGSVLAHEISPGNVEILPSTGVYLACFDYDASAPDTRTGVFASLRRGAHAVEHFFAPTPAYAGHAAISGTVRSLSPFQVVTPD